MGVLNLLKIKNFLPRSLLARSLLILTLPVFIILSTSTYVFFDRHWERMTSRLALAVAGEVAFIAEQVSKAQNFEQLEILRKDSLAHLQLNVQYMPEGKIISSSVRYIGRGNIIERLLSNELAGRIQYPFHVLVDTDEKWTQVQVQMPGGALIVTSPEKRLFSSSGYVFLIWMIGIATILLVVATLFMRNQIRPIKRLAIVADRYGKGRDVPFFKLEGAREVRQAARAFMGMRERIDRQIQQRTAMLAGVSHDLRTPLTRMKLQAELLPENADTKALKDDILEMERMIDGYLQFARGEGDEAMEKTDLMEILRRLAESFSRNGFAVSVQPKDKSHSLFLKPVAMERCFSNILSNAQKFGTRAEVRVSETEDNLVVTIDDDGKGIDPDLYEDVFKPFFREDTSRNSKTGGVGLGLPIAKDIVLAHGGEISLSRSPLKGLRVLIKFPV